MLRTTYFCSNRALFAGNFRFLSIFVRSISFPLSCRVDSGLVASHHFFHARPEASRQGFDSDREHAYKEAGSSKVNLNDTTEDPGLVRIERLPK